jgi:hypothetical protein
MIASEPAFATIAEVAPRIEAGEISPVELTDIALLPNETSSSTPT